VFSLPDGKFLIAGLHATRPHWQTFVAYAVNIASLTTASRPLARNVRVGRHSRIGGSTRRCAPVPSHVHSCEAWPTMCLPSLEIASASTGPIGPAAGGRRSSDAPVRASTASRALAPRSRTTVVVDGSARACTQASRRHSSRPSAISRPMQRPSAEKINTPPLASCGAPYSLSSRTRHTSRFAGMSHATISSSSHVAA
jgi:hypothetical protein